mmetsp:Transcript_61243/g.192809  ORF Transcript_61243/g.192809 Transcript_61243/m.192809 type:complete len:200 (+) Transcript_61243:1174-1773(+)
MRRPSPPRPCTSERTGSGATTWSSGRTAASSWRGCRRALPAPAAGGCGGRGPRPPARWSSSCGGRAGRTSACPPTTAVRASRPRAAARSLWHAAAAPRWPRPGPPVRRPRRPRGVRSGSEEGRSAERAPLAEASSPGGSARWPWRWPPASASAAGSPGRRRRGASRPRAAPQLPSGDPFARARWLQPAGGGCCGDAGAV